MNALRIPRISAPIMTPARVRRFLVYALIAFWAEVVHLVRLALS
jgi:hypothetical protein